jgi:hypothetical protein
LAWKHGHVSDWGKRESYVPQGFVYSSDSLRFDIIANLLTKSAVNEEITSNKSQCEIDFLHFKGGIPIAPKDSADDQKSTFPFFERDLKSPSEVSV